jgi:hypothetical protein
MPTNSVYKVFGILCILLIDISFLLSIVPMLQTKVCAFATSSSFYLVVLEILITTGFAPSPRSIFQHPYTLNHTCFLRNNSSQRRHCSVFVVVARLATFASRGNQDNNYAGLLRHFMFLVHIQMSCFLFYFTVLPYSQRS